MLIDLYYQLFIMAVVSGGLYLIVKIINLVTMRYFKASWHYYTNIIIYMFLLLPFYKLIDLFNCYSKPSKTNLFIPSLPNVMRLPSSNSNKFIMVTAKKEEVPILIIHFLPFLLIAGTLVFIMIVLIQNFKIHCRIFSVTRLSDDKKLRDILFRCRQEIGLSINVLVFISPYASTPFLYGLIKPCIVLPDIQFTDEELQHVFQHELIHWKRHDAWLKCLMLFINAIHWFNPLAYTVRHDIDRFCELSCDESAVGSMNNDERRRYCELMLGVLWNVTGHHVKLFSAFSDKRKQLERRMNIIMENNSIKNRKWVRMLAITLTLVLSLGGAVVAYAANNDGNEATIQLESEKTDAVMFNDTQQSHKTLGNEASISVAEDENGIEGLQNTQIIEPYASGSLSSGSSTSFDKQYLTSGDTITIAVTSSNDRDLSVGVKSEATGNIYASTVSGGNGSVVVTINTSGYYYIYVKNVSTGSTKFTCDYLVN